MSTSQIPDDISKQHGLAPDAVGDEKSMQNSSRGDMSDLETPMTQLSISEPTRDDRKQEDESASGAVSATATGPISTPFAHPLPTSKPLARAELTSEQLDKYQEVYNAVLEWSELPITSARNSTTSSVTDAERMWLTRECLLRYLRATSWNVVNAVKRLQTTLVWRREYDIAAITSDYIAVENETGKQTILGYDNDARPCLYQNPGKQNTPKSDRQIQHLVYMLERLIDMMDPGQETAALLINFKNSSSSSSPSVAQGRQTLTILQGHYPERLGKALISDLPWYVTTFFKFISPFIDPVTKEKMVFNQPLRNYVPPAQLDKAYGGDADFEYDHAQYWPALVKECEQRHAAYTKRWTDAGKRIGEYEAYLRGGVQKPLKDVEAATASPATHEVI